MNDQYQGEAATETYAQYTNTPAVAPTPYPMPDYAYGGATTNGLGQAIAGLQQTHSYGASFIPDPPRNPCRENLHNFACKHETYCVCGRVQRRGLEVSDGL